MDPLAGLDDVDFTALNHAYGSAGDIPDLLRQLAVATPENLQSIYYDLYGNLFHQGTRYSASVAAAPFLIALAESPTTIGRDRLIRYLVSLAIGYPNLIDGFDIKGIRAAASEVQADGYAEEYERKKAQYIADAPTDEERRKREREFMFSDSVDGIIHYTLIKVRIYDAVKGGLPVFRQALRDESASVRAMAAYALGWFPEEIETNQKELFDLFGRESDAAVRSTVLLSLSLLQTSIADSQPPSSSPIQTRVSEVFAQTKRGDLAHFCAALGLAMIGTPSAEHLEEITRKASDATYLQDYEPGHLSSATAFPFAEPDLASIACVSLRAVKGSEHPAVPLALASALPSSQGQATHAMAGVALRTAFDGKHPAPRDRPAMLPPFESLSVAQQAVVRALSEVEAINWNYLNYLDILRSWGLYSTQSELRRYIQASA